MRATQRIVPLLLAVASTLLLTGCGGPNLMDRIGGGFWSYGICGTLILIFDIIALFQIVGSNWTFGRKALWAAIIVFFPVGGLLMFWFFGKD